MTIRVLFINEGIGGHRTVHHNLERVLASSARIRATFLHVPPRRGLRRVVDVRLPLLGPLDLDLQPLRAALAVSAIVRRRLSTMDLQVFDALHLYTQNAGLLVPGLLRQHPSVVTTDATNATNAFSLPQRPPTRFTPMMLPAIQRLERRVYAAATTVVANTEWVATSLRQGYGLTEDRLRVLPFGVILPALAGPAPGPPAGEKPRLVFVGTSLKRKGASLLLELHQAHLRDACDLWLVTPEPVPPRPGVTVVADLRPGDPRLWDILRSSSMFVFPSTIDAAPNAVFEAMAAGLPVIAVRRAGLTETVVEGESGLLIRPDDGTGLRIAIEALLADPGRARAMGAAGRRRVEARFDMARNSEALIDLIEDAIATWRAAR